jgi:hypothetical protein
MFMGLYRFSPINDEEAFKKVFYYIADELDKLSNKLFNKSLPITTLKIFAHYPEEYDNLSKLLLNMGTKSSYSSATSLYIDREEKINNFLIKLFGVRITDPYRLQVGCGDFEIENFEEFKNENIDKSPFIRTFREDMLEIWHPDFDVLGYIIPKI